MTYEDKKLLLKDLSARLPYGVKASYYGTEEECETWDEIEGVESSGHIEIGQYSLPIERIKPYLYPLSSMTERQCYELSSIRSSFQDCWKYIKTPIPLSICNFEQIEWFHKNHLDYRGLIPMGLAIDATGKNIY